MFFVESAIMLIPAITKGILALAGGSIAAVGAAMEEGLGRLIPLIIGLFARLIGLGGLTKRVMKIFKKIRKRIDKAVNKLLKKAKKAGRKLMRKLGIGKKKKDQKKEDPDDKKGANKHSIIVYAKDDGQEVYMASKEGKVRGKVRGKVSRATDTIKNYTRELNNNPALKPEFEGEIKPLAHDEIESVVLSYVKQVEGLKSKERGEVLKSGKLKSSVDAIVDFLVSWGEFSWCKGYDTRSCRRKS